MMKTAQEMINDRKFNKRNPIVLEESAVIELMKQYARQACKEQRKICGESYSALLFDFSTSRTGNIVNAPEPELK